MQKYLSLVNATLGHSLSIILRTEILKMLPESRTNLLSTTSSILIIICQCAANVIALPMLESCQLIDLTHPFNSETIYWPGAKNFRHETVFNGITSNGYYYSAFNFAAAEHGGTHLDAPVHFAQNGQDVGEIPLDRLTGEGCIVNVSGKSSANGDYEFSIADVMEWEQKWNRSISGCILIFRTDWSKYWPNKGKYLGTATNDTKKLHFPGISPSLAKWLVENRKVKAVGLDTASMDHGQSTLFASHRIFASNNISGLENLMNLNKLPEQGSLIIALPMKIEQGSGAPIRVIAFISNDRKNSCFGLPPNSSANSNFNKLFSLQFNFFFSIVIMGFYRRFR